MVTFKMAYGFMKTCTAVDMYDLKQNCPSFSLRSIFEKTCLQL